MRRGQASSDTTAQLALFGDSASEPAAVTPALFRHPEARRDIVLDGHVVGYALRRARRRSIGFIVGAEGLSVAAPRWVVQADIDAALRDKAAWIVGKLAEQHARGERLRAARVEWRDGAMIRFLGQPVAVTLAAQVSGALLDPGAPGAAGARLQVGLPQAASAEQIRDAVQSWLQRQARRIFEERCAHFAERLQVTVRRVALSSAQTRWGSASADGSVRLNWRLVHFGMATIDYVVAHELAHLRHMNHGPEFWAVVRSVVPDLDQARGRLKDELVPVF
ncbi:MAG: M48 family metallopeptidase [Ideonella sp.]|nr:M48 family metallopeptidase [Ideonella sp.]MBP6778127.1 M48 family metallopeptidase [Piscinibacter sp.]